MTSDADADPLAARVHTSLRALWSQRRTEVRSELTTLDAALDRLVVDPLDAPSRRRAQNPAHQLGGIFGVFGLGHEKSLMAEIDAGLHGATLDTQQCANWRTAVRALQV